MDQREILLLRLDAKTDSILANGFNFEVLKVNLTARVEGDIKFFHDQRHTLPFPMTVRNITLNSARDAERLHDALMTFKLRTYKRDAQVRSELSALPETDLASWEDPR